MSHNIKVRKIPFEFANDISPVWNPAKPEWSHMVNGASLTMPYLEPFLIKNLREAAETSDALKNDPDLLADVRGFIGQEAQHYTNHRRYSEMLKANGYPELADVEASMVADYKKFSKRSLAWRLAYTAGFETMTVGVTDWLLNNRQELFGNANPVVSSLILWHMVEETEHKSVAFDVFQAVSGNYWLRALGLLVGSFHVGFMSRRGYRAMLVKEGRWSSLRSRLQLWRLVGQFFRRVGPAMLRGFAPNHPPDTVTDPEWITVWHHAYADLDEHHIPLLNTDKGSVRPAIATT